MLGVHNIMTKSYPPLFLFRQVLVVALTALSTLWIPVFAYAGDCTDVSNEFLGAWRTENNQVFIFGSGKTILNLDGIDRKVNNCEVSHGISASFYMSSADRKEADSVTIYKAQGDQPAHIVMRSGFQNIVKIDKDGEGAINRVANPIPVNNYITLPSVRFADEYETFNHPEMAREFGKLARILPGLKIVTKECGLINAWYSPADTTLTLCYEYLGAGNKVIDQQYSNLPIQYQVSMRTGIMLFVLMHELGHAMVHLKKIPLLGGEEDAADRIASVYMLEMAKDDPKRREAMVLGNLAFTWTLRPDLLEKLLAGKNLYMDEHPITEQRFYNLVCLAYGSDPSTFNKLKQSTGLDERRAGRCVHEYQQAKDAVWRLLN